LRRLDVEERWNRKGKLDATTIPSTTEVVDGGEMVNGPEDQNLDWDTALTAKSGSVMRSTTGTATV